MPTEDRLTPHSSIPPPACAWPSPARAAAAPGGPTRRRADPDLDRGAGDDRPPRPADAERAGRPRAGQAPDRHPHARLPRARGPGRAHPRSGRRPQLPGQRQRRRAASGCALRARKDAYLARRMRELPPTRSRRSSAPPRCSNACGRMSRVEHRPAPLLRLPRGPQLPALLRRPGGLAHRQLDADGRGDLADPQLTHTGVAVGLTTALQFLPMLLFGASAACSPTASPSAALLIAPSADGDPRRRAVRGHRRRRRRALDGLPRGLPWAAVNAVDNPARQSFVIEMVGPEGSSTRSA